VKVLMEGMTMSDREKRRDPIPDLDVPARHIAPLPPLSTDELDTATEIPPDLEGAPISEELTGRASKTEDDLGALFGNETEEHIEDGFKGGSGDEPELS
jgi:hypothetical protein